MSDLLKDKAFNTREIVANYIDNEFSKNSQDDNLSQAYFPLHFTWAGSGDADLQEHSSFLLLLANMMLRHGAN